MARQVGAYEYKKRIGDVHGYSRRGTKKGKVFAGKNGGASKSTFLTAASMANTRANASEFGGAGLQAVAFNKQVNYSFKESAGKVYQRFMKLFVQIIRIGTGVRGQRMFDIVTNQSQLLNFTIGRTGLKSSLLSPFTIVNGALNINTVVTFPTIPASDVKAPRGATHFRIKVGFMFKSNASYDPTSGKYIPDAVGGDFRQAAIQNGPWLPIGTDVAVPTVVTAGDGVTASTADETAITIVGIEFAQDVNGVKSPFIANFAASIEKTA